MRHAEHAENGPPVCCHTAPLEALSDTEEEQTVLVIVNGPVIFWKTQRAFFPDGQRQDRVHERKKWRSAKKTDFGYFSPHGTPTCHMSECSAVSQGLPGGWWVNRLTDPDPAQPHGTGGVCTAVQRNTGNRGNSLIASCAPHPPAKGSAAYLSWLNEDGGYGHTLDLHWESAE